MTNHVFFAEWIVGAGICAVVAVLSLAVFSLFAVLHVAMQLQRREIWVGFGTAVFLKVIAAAVAGKRTKEEGWSLFFPLAMGEQLCERGGLRQHVPIGRDGVGLLPLGKSNSSVAKHLCMQPCNILAYS